ncbi:hypothetical protein ACL1IP_08315 [Corynebacterium striatum]
MDAAQILDTLVWAALTFVCLLNLIAPSEEPSAEKTPKPTVQAGHFDELLDKLNQQKGRRT